MPLHEVAYAMEQIAPTTSDSGLSLGVSKTVDSAFGQPSNHQRWRVSSRAPTETSAFPKNISDSARGVFNANLISARLTSDSSYQYSDSLRIQIDQMESRSKAEFKLLSTKVDELARLVSTKLDLLDTPSATQSPVQESDLRSDVATLELAAAEGTLADHLDSLADAGVGVGAEAIQFAISYLGDQRPGVRAASARVLAMADAPKAKELIPELLEKEANRYVSSVLRGVLRSVQA